MNDIRDSKDKQRERFDKRTRHAAEQAATRLVVNAAGLSNGNKLDFVLWRKAHEDRVAQVEARTAELGSLTHEEIASLREDIEVLRRSMSGIVRALVAAGVLTPEQILTGPSLPDGLLDDLVPPRRSWWRRALGLKARKARVTP